MPFFMVILLFLCLAGGISFVGMKIYVRPKQAMDRVVGVVTETEIAPPHPSLAIHELIKKLGAWVPQSPKDVTVMQRRLIRAGIRNENSLKFLYGAKAAMAVALPLFVTALVSSTSMETGNKLGSIMIAVAVGYFG